MVKKEYTSLKTALEDFNKSIKEAEPKALEVTTVEFVKFNDRNMFEDTGASKKSVINNSEYKKGLVIGATPYFGFVYPTGGKTGKPKAFEYTYNENEEDLKSIFKKEIDKKL